MKRISRYVALSCVLSVLLPTPRILAGDATGAQDGGVAPEICFPLEDGKRMLKDLEALPVCRDAVKAGEKAINSNKIIAQALESRVAEQDREIADARKLVEDTRKAGQDAAKVAAGPWYSRALSVVKWVALGIIVGFVGGMAK